MSHEGRANTNLSDSYSTLFNRHNESAHDTIHDLNSIVTQSSSSPPTTSASNCLTASLLSHQHHSNSPSLSTPFQPIAQFDQPHVVDVREETGHFETHIKGSLKQDQVDTILDRADSVKKRQLNTSLRPVKSTPCSRLLPGPVYIRNIIVSELCERFSYYGVSSLLVTYLSEALHQSESTAITWTAAFTSLAYFTPLIGGYISDSYWGKFKTIIWLSLVYCAGSLLLALSALSAKTALIGCLIGLLLISIGTGGIKPSVSSFGADQFEGDYAVGMTHAELEKEQNIYFSAFYFSINLGSVGSFLIIPLLREHFGYGVAFGVPAVLLIVATFILWSARHKYTMIEPQGSVLANIWNAIQVARRTPQPAHTTLPKDFHWIDVAINQPIDEHRRVTVETCENYKALARVLPIFAVLPVFWCLFYQQTTSWILQAKSMNLLGLQQEQIGVVNPIFIMIFIPLFETLIYPTVERNGIHFTPLRKMAVGMVLGAAAFAMSAIVQMKIDSGSAHSVNVFWQMPQIALISAAEILISVTGLEFSYTEAPATLKSTLPAINLFSAAIGNFLTSVVFGIFSPFLTTGQIFLLFAGLMLVNTLIFLYVAKSFKSRVTSEQGNKLVVASEQHRGSDVSSSAEHASLIETHAKQPTDTTNQF